MQKLTRRNFIVKSTKYLGVGLGALTTGSEIFMPRNTGASDIHFPELSCGIETEDTLRVLIAYASMYGSTGGIAKNIGQVLCRKGAQVDVLHIENIREPKDYHAIIVGSAIRSSKWLPEAVEFVETNKRAFREKPVAYFLSCLTLCRSNEKTLCKAKTFLNLVREKVPEVKPIDIGLFPGVLDYSKMSFPIRIIMKRKMKQKDVKEGDYRNWASISAWASSLHARIVRA